MTYPTPLHDLVQQAIHGSMSKLGGVEAAQQPQQVAPPQAAVEWSADDVEKLAASLEYVADNLGMIADDRTPMERLAEQVHVSDALSKMAAGSGSPPMNPPTGDTFPSAPGVGLQTDMVDAPGGSAAQTYKPDHSKPQVTPPMVPPVVAGSAKSVGPGGGGMGEALQTDLQNAPGGSAKNPENPGAVGYKAASVSRIAGILKQAQDPSSPQPNIGGKVSGDPQQPALSYNAAPSGEQQPAAGIQGGGPPSSGGGNQLRRFIGNNQAPQAAKPGQLSVTQSRQDMAPLLVQPMMRSQYDSKLKENLDHLSEAGPKLASAQDAQQAVAPEVGDDHVKIAAARALLKKAAQLGTPTETMSPEDGFFGALMGEEKNAAAPGFVEQSGGQAASAPARGGVSSVPGTPGAPLGGGLNSVRKPGPQGSGPVLGSSTAPAAV